MNARMSFIAALALNLIIPVFTWRTP